LLIPSVTQTEIKEARTTLDSARAYVMGNKISFAQAVSLYSEDDNSKNNGGVVMGPQGSIYVTIDQLDKDMVVAL
jgi:peptidyl-prolyl cis-trans isomerase SurA